MDVAYERYSRGAVHKSWRSVKFDFGYRVGETIKLFHAVSLKTNVDQAMVLASRYPKIASSIAQMNKAASVLTAVVDDDLDRGEAEVAICT